MIEHINSNKFQINSNTKRQLEFQFLNVSQTLDNPGPPDTKVSNAVDGGGKERNQFPGYYTNMSSLKYIWELYKLG